AGCSRRRRRPGSPRFSGSRSFLRQPRLSDAFEYGREIRRMVDQPFDGEFGVEAACFRQGGLRLVHFARLRIGGGQVRIHKVGMKTRVDRLTILIDRGVELAEAQLRVARVNVKNASKGVART